MKSTVTIPAKHGVADFLSRYARSEDDNIQRHFYLPY